MSSLKSRIGMLFPLSVVMLSAVIVGLMSAVLGGMLTIFIVLPILALIFVFKDYRVGVICLVFLLPWASSPLIPQTRGVNLVNYVLAATIFSFGIRFFGAKFKIQWWPKDFFLFYILPVSIGLLVALPNLSTAARNFTGLESALTFSTFEFIKSRYIFGAVYIIFALLLAQAVRESAKPERFVGLFVAAGLAPALVVFLLIQLYGVSLSELQSQRSFMAPIGMHANEMAAMLALVLGPTLFVLPHWKSYFAKGFAALVLVLAGLALLLTFSRGGFLAMVFILVAFVVHRRQFMVLAGALLLLVTALLFAPPAFKERWLTGVETGAVQHSVGNLSDPLTAGRVAVWEKLLPEVKKSPLWGRGLNSTAWSELVRSGVYTAIHPHNMYLAILMDLGVLGLAALLYWYTKLLVTQIRLRRADGLSPVMQSFFFGSAISFMGVLIMNITNGNYLPRPEYSFFWFSVGLTFAFWAKAVPQVQTIKSVAKQSSAKGRPWGVVW
jgi:O-antigen ligase